MTKDGNLHKQFRYFILPYDILEQLKIGLHKMSLDKNYIKCNILLNIITIVFNDNNALYILELSYYVHYN